MAQNLLLLLCFKQYAKWKANTQCNAYFFYAIVPTETFLLASCKKVRAWKSGRDMRTRERGKLWDRKRERDVFWHPRSSFVFPLTTCVSFYQQREWKAFVRRQEAPFLPWRSKISSLRPGDRGVLLNLKLTKVWTKQNKKTSCNWI